MTDRSRTLACLTLLVGSLGALCALAPQRAGAQESRRIVVVPFNPINVTRAQADVVSAAFEAGLSSAAAYSLASREELAVALERRGLDLFGCTSDRVALELAAELSAGQVVRGDLSAREGGFSLKIRLLETSAGRAVYVDSLWNRSIEEMRLAMELAAFKLAGLVVIDARGPRIAREFAELFVETVPSRAQVYVNGIRKGVSPDLLDRVPLGRVQISARLSTLYGQKTVEVTRGLTQVSIPLTEASGSLLIACQENLDVYLDGGPLGPLGSGTFADIPVGVHTLELRGRGLYWSDDVMVRAGERTMVVALPVPHGAIEYAVPPGAAAEIAGGMVRQVVTGYGSLELPAGDYAVTVSGKDYEAVEGMGLTVARQGSVALRPQPRLARDAEYERFSRRLDETEPTVGYGLRLTAGDVARLEALRNEIASSRHAFPDLLARAQALAARAESIVGTEAVRPSAGAEAPAQAAERERRLNELSLRRQELELQLESRSFTRHKRVRAGWASFAAGVASGGLTGLFYYLADEAYRDYQQTELYGTWEEAQRKAAQFKLWRACTVGAIGLSGVGLATSSALWLSGPPRRRVSEELSSIEQQIGELGGQGP